jgi:hypothetical protein
VELRKMGMEILTLSLFDPKRIGAEREHIPLQNHLVDSLWSWQTQEY